MLKLIKESWSWYGIDPVRILEVNEFGNVILQDRVGHFYRICPEELEIKLIAKCEEEFDAVRQGTEFVDDWNMSALLRVAKEKFGAPGKGRCFCLKIPAALGGGYEIDNIGTISVSELVSFAGDIANQLKNVPAGTKVKLKIVK